MCIANMRLCVHHYGQNPPNLDEVRNEIGTNYVQDSNVPTVDCLTAIKNCLVNTKRFKISTSFGEIESTSDRADVYMPSDVDELYNHIISYRVSDKDLQQFNIGDIKSVLLEWKRECKLKAVSNIYNQIKYDSQYEQFANNYIRKVYDYFGITEKYDIFETLFKHWMWQVKRKLCNKPVVWHIWINFFGGTGIGKSYFIDKLTESLEEYSTRTTISKLFDDTKEIKRLTEKFILNFDELAINRDDASYEGALSSDEQATLKSMLTGEYLDTRVYGTQDQARKRITFSCISSSNTHLYDVIYDETSMRRFFDFNCSASVKEDKDYQDFNIWLNQSKEFWKGINENLDKGYWIPSNEIGKEIFEIQRKYYPTKSTITYWNQYFEFVKTNDKKIGGVQISYTEYKSWCKESGYNAKSLNGYIQEMKKRFPELIGNDGTLCFEVKNRTDDTETPFLSRLTETKREIEPTLGF